MEVSAWMNSLLHDDITMTFGNKYLRTHFQNFAH